eukprot:TRINITY_DN5519_c0_g1_i2.p1 TRINITY_DN5519_c0_g1~~TRINITY_DN5519_c0_g1_i2.p1  ORF type:complete len:378 (-),score=126.60 TRINITY_DN5519_c0_g1_i2:187-1320(-)
MALLRLLVRTGGAVGVAAPRPALSPSLVRAVPLCGSALGRLRARDVTREAAGAFRPFHSTQRAAGEEEGPVEVSEGHVRARAQQLLSEGEARLRARDGRGAFARITAGLDLCTQLGEGAAQTWRGVASLAAALHLNGEYEAAHAEYSRALDLCKEAGEEGSVACARLLVSKVDLCLRLREFDQAQAIGERAIVALDGKEVTELAAAHFSVGGVLGAKALEAAEGGDDGTCEQLLEEARGHVDRAEAIFNKVLGWNSPYSVACVQQRMELQRVAAPRGDLSEFEAEMEARSSTAEPQQLEPVEAPSSMAIPLIEQWKSMGVRGACDPRGMVLPPSLLKHELGAFVRAWKDKGLPLDASVMPALEREAEFVGLKDPSSA